MHPGSYLTTSPPLLATVTSLTRPLARILTYTADIIFPRECFSCGAVGSWLCPSCCLSHPLISPPSCPVCRKTTFAGSVHASCKRLFPLDYFITAASLAHPVTRSLVYGLKYQGLCSAAPLLAALAFRACAMLPFPLSPSSAVCAPIPLSPHKQRSRGYNQSSLIARAFSTLSHLPFSSLLDSFRPTRDQIGLTKSQRYINLDNAFRLSPSAPALPLMIVLIDDVVTSGATMGAAARTLRKHSGRPLTLIGLATAYNSSYHE